MALQERQRSGRGQFVEASLYDSGLSLLHPHAANWFAGGREPTRSGNAHPNIYPYDAFDTASEPIFLAVGNDRQFQLLCDYLGKPELPVHPDYATAGARSVNRAALRQQLLQALSTRQGGETAQALMDRGVPCAAVLSVSQALQHPHTVHREMVVKVEPNYTGIASPIKLSRTPATYRKPPP
jgi:crotonobetainyl-CoA:carnitine CoA-transferase CaiB-like acyl-CoA transferase